MDIDFEVSYAFTLFHIPITLLYGCHTQKLLFYFLVEPGIHQRRGVPCEGCQRRGMSSHQFS